MMNKEAHCDSCGCRILMLMWTSVGWLLLLLSQQLMVEGAEHTVGRSAGWTIPAVGNVNYSTWAAAFTLSLGDVLVFKYDATLHDVLRVTMDDYNACNASQPMAIYNTGETFITLDQVGTWCFLCGVPGHCLAGQKLQVNVGLMPPSMAPSSAEEQQTPLHLPQPPSPSPRASINATHILNAPTSLRPPLRSPYPSHISPPKASSADAHHSPSSWAPSYFPKLQPLLMVLVVAQYLIVV